MNSAGERGGGGEWCWSRFSESAIFALLLVKIIVDLGMGRTVGMVLCEGTPRVVP